MSSGNDKIMVTRHKDLIIYAIELGIITKDTPVYNGVNPGFVKGRHVVGVVPLHVAASADKVTVIPIMTPAELRGCELNLGQLRRYAGKLVTYKVTVVEDDGQ